MPVLSLLYYCTFYLLLSTTSNTYPLSPPYYNPHSTRLALAIFQAANAVPESFSEFSAAVLALLFAANQHQLGNTKACLVVAVFV